ncbi:hypothetical protein ACFSUS_03090 [Spirosoma soli]|uniref:Uncharacterized protein n=1 Tax=Spirosoma soli TaxID=1770529 RepID=A0ABW5LXV2_9BACT
MRLFSIIVFGCFYTSICFGQSDSTLRQQKPPVQEQILIPGVDSPISSPGTLMQSSTRPNEVVTPGSNQRKRKGRTTPPSDPRAFGVGIPVGEAKKDTTRN